MQQNACIIQWGISIGRFYDALGVKPNQGGLMGYIRMRIGHKILPIFLNHWKQMELLFFVNFNLNAYIFHNV